MTFLRVPSDIEDNLNDVLKNVAAAVATFKKPLVLSCDDLKIRTVGFSICDMEDEDNTAKVVSVHLSNITDDSVDPAIKEMAKTAAGRTFVASKLMARTTPEDLPGCLFEWRESPSHVSQRLASLEHEVKSTKALLETVVADEVERIRDAALSASFAHTAWELLQKNASDEERRSVLGSILDRCK